MKFGNLKPSEQASLLLPPNNITLFIVTCHENQILIKTKYQFFFREILALKRKFRKKTSLSMNGWFTSSDNELLKALKKVKYLAMTFLLVKVVT